MARTSWTFGDRRFVTMAVDAGEVLGLTEVEVKKQLPFAQALALTWTAKDAQKDLRRRLPGTFTIRNTYVARGIRIQKATKREPVAIVGSIHPFMRLHALGGMRKPEKTDKVSIPVRARPTPTAKTTRAKFPSRITAKRGFVGVMRDKRNPGVWKIVGGKKNRRLMLMYVLREQAKIRKTWQMEQQVERTVRRVWDTNAAKALQRAFKTAKRRVRKSRI